MHTSFHSQVEVGFVYTCTSVAYCSRVLTSEVYEWSLPSTGAREYSMSISLWLTYSQNTREWDVASERCRTYVYHDNAIHYRDNSMYACNHQNLLRRYANFLSQWLHVIFFIIISIIAQHYFVYYSNNNYVRTYVYAPMQIQGIFL